MSISIVGSANRDLVVKVDKLAQPGQTIISQDYEEFCGGKGANQAVAARRLDKNVNFITKLGKDSFGDRLLEFYKKVGFDTSTINQDPNSNTGLAFISVDKKGQNIINVVMGANAKLDQKTIDKYIQQIISSKIVLTQLETPLETIQYLAGKLTDKQTFILNPAPARELPQELLQKVDILTPNETEASILSGVEVKDIETAKQAAKELHKKGVKTVIITLGEKGALLSKSDTQEQKLFPTRKVDVVDTTAAGDTFNGVLAFCLDKDFSIEKSIEIANIASALAVTVAGAENSAPTLEKLNTYLEEKI
ncbi:MULTISPECIES: ribokinase [unclassified Francisella]|uniref:ribokinase n=1 Tax=unclassified Francisella TaxID=2610885 RepID=UPI002E35EA43|nr:MULTISPECIES: ribokinase [unclassified Francisella]MED7819358.1 ribokinase [Francisella sp. 19S2-4]MED7830185.1 ribokinase [Francisella sp. 19S2-10]